MSKVEEKREKEKVGGRIKPGVKGVSKEYFHNTWRDIVRILITVVVYDDRNNRTTHNDASSVCCE